MSDISFSSEQYLLLNISNHVYNCIFIIPYSTIIRLFHPSFFLQFVIQNEKISSPAYMKLNLGSPQVPIILLSFFKQQNLFKNHPFVSNVYV